MMGFEGQFGIHINTQFGTRYLYFLGTGGNPLFAASNSGINFSLRGVPSFTAKNLSVPSAVFPHIVTPA